MEIYRFIVDTDRHRHLEAIKVLKVLTANPTIFSIMAAIIGFSMAPGGDDFLWVRWRLRH
ncbi:hypothetical protein FVER14953_20267 [Fusarium verticillioides]|nr:hypothetical protein FVER14953_20267 [Fusarium verticillioides]